VSVEDFLSTAVGHHQAGRLEAAKTHYEQVLEASPGHADALHFLGLIAHQRGDHDAALARLDAAIASRGDAAPFHNNRGSILLALGRAEEAAASYRQALTLRPDYVEALSNLGGVLVRLGQGEEAATACRRALALDPSHAEAHNNLGSAERERGDAASAASSFRAALALDPNHAEAHLNLGTVLQEEGDLAAAEASYRRALAARPDHAEAHYNLGIALRAMGRGAAALDAFADAIAGRPGNADAHHERAITLAEQGRFGEAADACRQAIGLVPGETAYAHTLARVLARLSSLDAEAHDDLARYLAADNADPQPLRRFLARALREAATAEGALSSAPGGAISEQAFERSLALLDDPLWSAFLAKDRLVDTDLERWLAAVRRHFLDAAATGSTAPAAGFEVLCALADHFYLNEFVAPESAAATTLIETLIGNSARHSATGAAVDPVAVAVLAMYRPLASIPFCRSLDKASLPARLAEIVVRQVDDPAAEAAGRDRIETLTAVDDQVSRAVRDQYEENPYPRWRATHLPTPRPLPAVMSELYPRLAGRGIAWPPAPRILVAGCGTGKHLVQTARVFAGAQVTAIDLSRASLAYAMRQADRLGIDNIRFAQADITRLGADAGPFDIIECSGVLHHLENPIAGWRVLVDRLAAGGAMAIGLYSTKARRHVAAARAFRDRHRYPATVEGVRQCRQDIIALDDDDPAKPVVASSDFYTLSSCRDLIFHVQEHTFDLPAIGEAISTLGLEFLGFVHSDPSVPAAYRARFPDDPDATDLDCWNRFETDNPDTFAAMYQFWVRKP
jgi:tetratricopeptide (TPR) repeat protein/SAM-dependent methyltransferase